MIGSLATATGGGKRSNALSEITSNRKPHCDYISDGRMRFAATV